MIPNTRHNTQNFNNIRIKINRYTPQIKIDFWRVQKCLSLIMKSKQDEFLVIAANIIVA